jgi:hypothetical protein
MTNLAFSIFTAALLLCGTSLAMAARESSLPEGVLEVK